MVKINKISRRAGSRRHRVSLYPVPSFHTKVLGNDHQKKKQLRASVKDWKDATCSVCMESPHNAVLLLCSSHQKGCRPYMCATGFRYSNCLEQYKKAYTKAKSLNPSSFGLEMGAGSASELSCPLCRGQVKGWTVVEPARWYLNAKTRACTQDNCSFAGTYKELRKHVKADHPCARPQEVDPLLAEKWKKLENDWELNDVMSTISLTMPGSIVVGDYVIEGNFRGFSPDYDRVDYLGDVVLRLESFGQGPHSNLDDPRAFLAGTDGPWDGGDEEEDTGIHLDDDNAVSSEAVNDAISRICCRRARLILRGSRGRRRRGRSNRGR